MARIIKGDIVIVTTGRDKGKEGRVLRVVTKSGRVVVEGVNMAHKHMRRSQDHPQGARITKEMPIHASNVMLKDPKTGKPTRVKYKADAKPGQKASRVKRRYAASGEEIEKVAKK